MLYEKHFIAEDSSFRRFLTSYEMTDSHLQKKCVAGVLKVLFAPFVIAGLTRNPLINSIIF